MRTCSVLLFNGTLHRISKIKLHEKYFSPRIYHDIAIVTLKDRIHFTDHVSPICLPKGNMYGENMCDENTYVAGFGDLSFGGAPASVLQEVDLKVINNSKCEKSYSNLIESKLKFPLGIKRSLICAGHEKGEKDACQV